MMMNSLRLIPSISSLRPSGPVIFRQPRWAPLNRRPHRPQPVAASPGPETASACAPARPVTAAVEAHVDVVGGSHRPLYYEETIEKVIYRCRFMAILGVLGSLMGSVLCFLKGCVYVLNSFIEYTAGSGKVILMVVEAIDVYLIGTVMLVFGMGLYELFISNFDIAKTSSYGSNLLGLFKLSERPKWLEIQSVNELKTKLGHVIVMVLLVGLFEKSRKVTISSPTDLLCFAASILLLSSCLYLLSKLHSSKESKHA